MAAGDVWGDRWLASWGVSWAQAELPVVVVDVGGDDVPRRRTRRHTKTAREEADALYDSMAQTLREVLAGPAPRSASVAPVALPQQTTATMATLVELAAPYEDLTQRVTELKRAFVAYQQMLIAEDDADWEWFL